MVKTEYVQVRKRSGPSTMHRRWRREPANVAGDALGRVPVKCLWLRRLPGATTRHGRQQQVGVTLFKTLKYIYIISIEI